jgi:hypothetical protein
MYKVPMATRQFTIVTRYLAFTRVVTFESNVESVDCGFGL